MTRGQAFLTYAWAILRILGGFAIGVALWTGLAKNYDEQSAKHRLEAGNMASVALKLGGMEFGKDAYGNDVITPSPNPKTPEPYISNQIVAAQTMAAHYDALADEDAQLSITMRAASFAALAVGISGLVALVRTLLGGQGRHLRAIGRSLRRYLRGWSVKP